MSDAELISELIGDSVFSDLVQVNRTSNTQSRDIQRFAIGIHCRYKIVRWGPSAELINATIFNLQISMILISLNVHRCGCSMFTMHIRKVIVELISSRFLDVSDFCISRISNCEFNRSFITLIINRLVDIGQRIPPVIC